MIDSTRRNFLIQALAVAMLPREVFAHTEPASDARELLGNVLDAIIPQSDDMPSAAAVGGTSYIEQLGWQYPPIAEDIQQFLGLVKKESSGLLEKGSGSLSPEQMVEVLKILEQKNPDLFSKIVAYAYEAYYVQPVITGLISCPAPIETDMDGQELLAPVSAGKHQQREVP